MSPSGHTTKLSSLLSFMVFNTLITPQDAGLSDQHICHKKKVFPMPALQVSGDLQLVFNTSLDFQLSWKPGELSHNRQLAAKGEAYQVLDKIMC